MRFGYLPVEQNFHWDVTANQPHFQYVMDKQTRWSNCQIDRHVELEASRAQLDGPTRRGFDP
jgi:hypothetical protein